MCDEFVLVLNIEYELKKHVRLHKQLKKQQPIDVLEFKF